MYPMREKFSLLPKTNTILRAIAGFYLIIVFPVILIYSVFAAVTDLPAKPLMLSCLPVAAILIVIYSIWMVKPRWLRSVFVDDKHSLDGDVNEIQQTSKDKNQ